MPTSPRTVFCLVALLGGCSSGSRPTHDARSGADQRAAGADRPTAFERRRLTERFLLAVARHDVEGVRAALDAGADPNERVEFGTPSLISAAWWFPGLEFVPRDLGDRRPRREFTRAEVAANAQRRWRATVQMVELLLERGARTDQTDARGKTPLVVAGYNGPPTTEVVDLLLARGADVHARAKDGDTALHIAALQDAPHIIQTLVRHGLAVDVRRDDGITALMWAAGVGARENVNMLLSLGADPAARDADGRGVLQYALRSRDRTTIRLVKEVVRRHNVQPGSRPSGRQ